MNLETAIKEYKFMLNSATANDDFYNRVAELCTLEPHFFLGYFELFLLLESEGKTAEQFELVSQVHPHIVGCVQSYLHEQSAYRENLEAGLFLLQKYASSRRLGFFQKGEHMKHQKMLVNAIEQAVTCFDPVGTHLRKEEVDAPLTEMQAELVLRPTLWFANRTRQNNHHIHRDTNAIVLRKLGNLTEKYVPVDGVHESERTTLCQYFPVTINFIESFAKSESAGLGRVALVRLKPYGTVYRHYDAESHTYLKGRTRYHFVLSSGAGNIISAGAEQTKASPGEMWFFDNAVMHHCFNRSNEWRVHVIFDLFENIENK